MRQRFGGEAHEVAGPDLDFARADFRDAAAGQDVNEFLVAIMRVVLGGFVAGRDAHEMDAHVAHADGVAQRFAVPDRALVEHVNAADFDPFSDSGCGEQRKVFAFGGGHDVFSSADYSGRCRSAIIAAMKRPASPPVTAR